MKVLLINPNSNGNMTLSLRELVEKFKTDYIDVTVVGMTDTPDFVGSQDTIDKTFDSVKKTILESKNNYDLFILACHLDPNLERLRKDTKQTILGIGECSLLFSKMLGKTFSIIGSSEKTVNLKRDMTERYGALDMLDYIGYPDEDSSGDLVDKLADASGKAIKEYDSDAIVLGCAGFVDYDSYIEKKIGKEVIDGVVISLIIADGYAKYKSYKTK